MTGRNGLLIALMLMALIVIVNSSYVEAACIVRSYAKDSSGTLVAANITTTCVNTSATLTSYRAAGQATNHQFGGAGDSCDNYCGSIIVNGTNTTIRYYGYGEKNPMDSSNEGSWTSTTFVHLNNLTLNLSMLPQITVNSPMNTTYNTNIITVSFNATDDAAVSSKWFYNGSANTTYTSPINVTLPDGTYTFIFYANDTANYLNQTNVTFTIDATAPSFNQSLTQPSGQQYNQTQTIPISVSITENSTVTANITWDSISQLVNLTYNGTQWIYVLNFTNTTYPGTYNITIIAKDLFNNTNSTATNFTINDVTSPQINITGPTTGQQYNQSQTIPISTNITDPYYDNMGTVIANVTWNTTYQTIMLAYNPGTGLYEGNFTNTTLIGQYNITVIAIDNANNTNTSMTEFNINDVTAPTTITITPMNQTVTNVTEQNFSANFSDNTGLANATLMIYNSTGLYNETTITFAGNPTEYTASLLVSLAEGVYNWFWKVADTAGNIVTSQNKTIQIDTTKPSITINSPDNITYNNRTVLVDITATDPNADKTWYNWNGTDVMYTGATDVNFSEGANTLTVHANDTAGNVNTTSKTFTVDTTKPSIQFTAPTETSGSSVNRKNIEVNVTADDIRLADITIRLYDSGNALINTTTFAGSPIYANFTGLANGIYYFNATACDTVGNCNSTETRNVTINLNVNAPAIFIATVAANKQDVILNWSAVPEADGYKIWYDTDVVKILQMNENTILAANVTLAGTGNNSWIDTTANTTRQRFYAVAAYRMDAQNMTYNKTGKFDVHVLAGESTISFPLISQQSFTDVFPTGVNDGASVSTHNRTDWIYNYYDEFSGQWSQEFGFDTIEPGQGYWTHGFASPINITGAGTIPRNNVTANIPAGEWTMGWESILPRNFTEAFPLGVNDAATVSTYNGTQWVYNYYDEFSTAWSQEFGFDTMEAGQGYWTHGFTSEANVTYTRNG